ncbi:MAG: protein kinase [Candidatus Brocadiia bacterium]|nr:protein kinase [Candidatus Brocadiia bacterium]
MRAGRDSLCYQADSLKLRMPVLVEVFPRDLPGYRRERVVTILDGLSEASRLHHPNVVALIDVGRGEDCDFVVTEWLGAGSVRARVPPQTGAAMKAGETLRVAEEVLMALQAGREAGLTHGLIRPDVILLDYDDTCKLAEFGRPVMREDLYEFSPTKKGGLTGACFYLAPERAEDLSPGDSRSDLYGLGVTLYEALSGARPVEGRTAQEVLDAHLAGSPWRIGERVPDLPEPVAALVSRLIARRPEDRPEGPEAALAELRELAAPLGKQGKLGRVRSAVTTKEERRSLMSRTTLWLVLALVMAVLIAIPPTYMLLKRKEEATEEPRAVDIGAPARVVILLGPATGSGAEALPVAMRQSLLAMAAAQVSCVDGLVAADPFLSEALRAAGKPVEGPVIPGTPGLLLTVTHSPGLGRRKWKLAIVDLRDKGPGIAESVAAEQGTDDLAVLGPAMKNLLVRRADKLCGPGAPAAQHWPEGPVWEDAHTWRLVGPAMAAEYDGRFTGALEAIEPVPGGEAPSATCAVLERFYRAAKEWEAAQVFEPAPVGRRDGLWGELEKLAGALDAMAGEDPAAIRAALADYLEAYPHSPRAHFLLGVWRSTAEQASHEAAAAFWKAVETDPGYLPAARAAARLAALARPERLDALLNAYGRLPHTEGKAAALAEYGAVLSVILERDRTADPELHGDRQ